MLHLLDSRLTKIAIKRPNSTKRTRFRANARLGFKATPTERPQKPKATARRSSPNGRGSLTKCVIKTAANIVNIAEPTSHQTLSPFPHNQSSTFHFACSHDILRRVKPLYFRR